VQQSSALKGRLAEILCLEAGLTQFVSVLGETIGARADDAANEAGAGAEEATLPLPSFRELSVEASTLS
jgi:hypothetical protein